MIGLIGYGIAVGLAMCLVVYIVFGLATMGLWEEDR